MTPGAAPISLGFCITDLDFGGAEKALVQIVTRLDHAEWAPFVVCLSGRGILVDQLERADVPVVCLGASRRRQLSIVLKLARELRQRRPALVQTFLYHANIAGRIAGKLAGVPKIVSGIRVAERRSKLPLRVDRLTQFLVDRHVCVSRAVADFSIREAGLDANRVTVIPNGVDVEHFKSATPADLSKFGIPPASRTVIWVGRLDPQKNPLAVIDAAEFLARQSSALQSAGKALPSQASAGPPVHFLFVGEGPLRGALERAVQQKGLAHSVHLAGWQSDVASLLKSADCLLLTSAWEGMPNVVLEAMASGLPVVAHDVEGVGEVVRDGETGLLLPSADAAAVCAAIEQLFAERALADGIAHSAQDCVQQRFTWDTVAKAYADLYRSLLKV